jgi:hypothetical protein
MSKNWVIRIMVQGNERTVYAGSDFQKASICIGEILLQEQIQQMRIWQDGELFQVIEIYFGSAAKQALLRCAPKRSRGPGRNRAKNDEKNF